MYAYCIHKALQSINRKSIDHNALYNSLKDQTVKKFLKSLYMHWFNFCTTVSAPMSYRHHKKKVSKMSAF